MKQHIVAFLAILLCGALAGVQARADGQVATITRTFKAPSGGLLKVYLSTGNIRVTGRDRDEVVVRMMGVGDDEKDQVHIGMQGTTISVESDASGDDESDVSAEIDVPTHFDADIQTSDGNIEIGGTLTGTVRGTTAGGNLVLGNIGGRIDLTTSGGNVDAGDLRGDVSLGTSGGDIRMGSVTGDADVSTSGGDIILKDVGKRLRAKTAGGNVTIRNISGTADVSTAGGNVSAGAVSGNASLVTAGGDIELRAVSGSARVSTAGGNILLEGVTGSTEASSAAGTIDAGFASSPTGDSRLSAENGDIHLIVPENAKVTIKARIHVGGWWRNSGDAYEIQSDFKFDRYEKDEQTHEIRADVSLNGGGRTITLRATMGTIRITKEGHRQ